jgi:hypothetical protein
MMLVAVDVDEDWPAMVVMELQIWGICLCSRGRVF